MRHREMELAHPGQLSDPGCELVQSFLLDDSNVTPRKRVRRNSQMPRIDNSGALFKNKDRKSDKHPLYSGSALIDGRDYFLDAWVNIARESGESYMGIKFKLKDQQSGGADPVRTTSGAAPATAPDAAPAQAPPVASTDFGGFGDDDDIPF